MATVSILKNITKLSPLAKKPLLASHKILKCQSAGLLLKSLRDPDFKHPPPFNYKENKYGLIAQMFDKGCWRFNENSKVIVVDGALASGKTELAKFIAEQYDLHYIPPASIEEYFILESGFDLRTINDQLPWTKQAFDIHEFIANPFDKRAALMHMKIYRKRVNDYVDALAHVLNTGQGVVMERSVFSDIVFVNTFAKFGFYSESFKRHMYNRYIAILDELLRPHMIIYLHLSPEETIKRIKARNLPYEANSPLYTPEVLSYMNLMYKNYLENMERHAEVLVYKDWAEDPDMLTVVEDMGDANLDEYYMYNDKMRDWRVEPSIYFWTNRRALYTNDKQYFDSWTTNIIDLQCEEVFVPEAHAYEYSEIVHNMVGNEYEKGYNIKQGEPYPFLKGLE